MKMSGGFVWVLCSFIPRLTEDSGLKPGHLLPQNCHLEKRTFQISKKVLCLTSIFCRARAAFASSTSFLRLTFSFSRKAALKAIWFSFSLLASRDLFLMGVNHFWQDLKRWVFFTFLQQLCSWFLTPSTCRPSSQLRQIAWLSSWLSVAASAPPCQRRARLGQSRHQVQLPRQGPGIFGFW